MSDSELGAFATAGSGKSTAEVAFDLLNKLKGQGVWGERNLSDILDMYAECLDAANGHRAYAGQDRVESPVKKPASPTQARAQLQPPAAPAMQARPATPLQAPPQQQTQPRAQQQPVHAQQAAVQQAFKPG